MYEPSPLLAIGQPLQYWVRNPRNQVVPQAAVALDDGYVLGKNPNPRLTQITLRVTDARGRDRIVKAMYGPGQDGCWGYLPATKTTLY